MEGIWWVLTADAWSCFICFWVLQVLRRREMYCWRWGSCWVGRGTSVEGGVCVWWMAGSSILFQDDSGR